MLFDDSIGDIMFRFSKRITLWFLYIFFITKCFLQGLKY